MDFVNDAISEGFFVYLFLDRYYAEIDPRCQKMKEHFYHQVFINGFDEEKNTIKYEDNIDFGKYITTEMNKENFEQAYWSMDDSSYQYVSDIYIFKYRKESQFPEKFDVNELILQLEDFSNSRPYIDLLKEQECNFGIQCMHNLLKETREELSKEKFIIIRNYHFLYEYQLLMEMRINYLIRKKYLKADTDLAEKCENIKLEFLNVRNLILKYNTRLDLNYKNLNKEKITDTLKLATDLEEKFIHQLISELKET